MVRKSKGCISSEDFQITLPHSGPQSMVTHMKLLQFWALCISLQIFQYFPEELDSESNWKWNNFSHQSNVHDPKMIHMKHICSDIDVIEYIIHLWISRGIIRTLHHRCDTICTTDEAKADEIEHPKKELAMSGYTKPKTPTVTQDPDKTNIKGHITLPYVGHVADAIAWVICKSGAAVHLRLFNTIHIHLIHPKDKVCQEDKAMASQMTNNPEKHCFSPEKTVFLQKTLFFMSVK